MIRKLSSSSSSTEGERDGKTSQLLANYYGINSAKEKNNEASTSDIDSPEFHPKLFTKLLLQQYKQEALLRKDDEIRREVKKLDSDMQMLVYENYNKFISATDTIRNMKQNVESMESEMGSLQESMEKINNFSEGINASLADKRSRVDTLVRVRRLLKRLEFLFELPSILHSAIDRGAFAQAIQYYSMTHEILRKHSEMSSFGSILVESEEIMSNFRLKLLAKVGSPGIAQGPFVETVCLLLKLGVPSSGLCDRFVAFHVSLFNEWLQSSRKSLVDDSSLTFESVLVQLSGGFLPLLLRTAKVYKRLFQADNESSEIDASSPMGAKVIHKSVLEYFQQLHDKAERSRSVIETLEIAKLGKETDQSDQESLKTDNFSECIYALSNFLGDALEFHRRLREAEIKPKAEKFVIETKLCRIQDLFGVACGELLPVITNFLTTVSDEKQVSRLEGIRGTYKRQTGYQILISDLILAIGRVFGRAITSCEAWLPPITTPESLEEREALCNQIHRYTWLSVCWIKSALEYLLKMTPNGWDTAEVLPCENDNEYGSVDTSQESTQYESHSLENNLKMLRQYVGEVNLDAFPSVFKCRSLFETDLKPSTRAALAAALVHREMNVQLVGRMGDMLSRLAHLSMPQQHIEEIVRWYNNYASELFLECYVEISGCQLVDEFKNSYLVKNEWTKSQTSPISASNSARSVIDRLDKASIEVSFLLGDSNRAGAISTNRVDRDLRRTARASFGGSRMGLQLDIDRIFAGDVSILGGKIQFNGDSILSGILKVVFKAGAEIIRDLTLSIGGYQQIQIDVEFWRQVIVNYVYDTSVLADVDHLIDQVMIAALERSLDTSYSMDSALLSSIVSKDISALR